MNSAQIRTRFQSVVGDSDYRKFLLALHGGCVGKGRLYFWQEQMWRPFAKENGLPESDYQEIRKLFSYCYVHGVEFDEGEVPIIYGTFAKPKAEEIQAALEEYPYANDVSLGPCWDEGQTKTKVFYCRECRIEKERRRAANT